jgi:hypothetical protein
MLPDKVFIGPYTFRVTLGMPHRALSDRMGMMSRDYLEFYIREDVPLDQQRATLLHEWVHAVSDIYLLELGERAVEVLGTAFLELLKRNPQVVRFLLDGEEDHRVGED